jgi:hypothetical protein
MLTGAELPNGPSFRETVTDTSAVSHMGQIGAYWTVLVKL